MADQPTPDRDPNRSAHVNRSGYRCPQREASQSTNAGGEGPADLPSGSHGDPSTRQSGIATPSSLLGLVSRPVQSAPQPETSLERYAVARQTADPGSGEVGRTVSRSVDSPITVPPIQDDSQARQVPRMPGPDHRPSASDALPPIVSSAGEPVLPLSQAPPPLAAWTTSTPPASGQSSELAQEPVTVPSASVPAITIPRPDHSRGEIGPGQEAQQWLSVVLNSEKPSQTDPQHERSQRRVRFEEPSGYDDKSEESARSRPDMSALSPGPLYRPREEEEPEERPPKQRRYIMSSGNSDRPYLPRGSEGVPTEGPPPLFSDRTKEDTSQVDSRQDHPLVCAVAENTDSHDIEASPRLDTENRLPESGKDKGRSAHDDKDGTEGASIGSDAEDGSNSLAEDRPQGRDLSSGSGPPPVKSRGRPCKQTQVAAPMSAAPEPSSASSAAKRHEPKGKGTKIQNASSTSARKAAAAVEPKVDASANRSGPSSEALPQKPDPKAQGRSGDASTAAKEADAGSSASKLSMSTDALQSRGESATRDGIPRPQPDGWAPGPASVTGEVGHDPATGTFAGRPVQADSSAAEVAGPRPPHGRLNSEASLDAGPSNKTAGILIPSVDHSALGQIATSRTLRQPVQAQGANITSPWDGSAPLSGGRESGAVHQWPNFPQGQHRHDVNFAGFPRLGPLHMELAPAAGATTPFLPDPEYVEGVWWQWMPCWAHAWLNAPAPDAAPLEIQARACELMAECQHHLVQVHAQRRAAAGLRLQTPAQQPQSEFWYHIASDLQRRLSHPIVGSSHCPSVLEPPRVTHWHPSQSASHQLFQRLQQASGSSTELSSHPAPPHGLQQPLSQPAQQLARQASHQPAYQPSQQVPTTGSFRGNILPPPMQAAAALQPEITGHDLVTRICTKRIPRAAYRVLQRFETVFQLSDLVASKPELLVQEVLTIASQENELELALQSLMLQAHLHADPILLQFVGVAYLHHQEALQLLRAYGSLSEYRRKLSDLERLGILTERWRNKIDLWPAEHQRAETVSHGHANQVSQRPAPSHQSAQLASEQAGHTSARPPHSLSYQQQARPAPSQALPLDRPISCGPPEPRSASQRPAQQAQPNVSDRSANPQQVMRAGTPRAEPAVSHHLERQPELLPPRQNEPRSTARGSDQLVRRANPPLAAEPATSFTATTSGRYSPSSRLWQIQSSHPHHTNHADVRQQSPNAGPSQPERSRTVMASQGADLTRHQSIQQVAPRQRADPANRLDLLCEALQLQPSLLELPSRESNQSRASQPDTQSSGPSQPGPSRTHPPSQP